MRDNFNMYEWRLKQAINELEEKQLCKECGEGYMEEGQCMECGYLEEGKSTTANDLVVRWTKKYLNNEKNDPYFYTEKGLADGFEVIGGQKVKEIIGYDEDDNDEVIGHIYSKTKKDIETDYSEEDLDDAFTTALASVKEGVTFTDKHDDNPKLKGGQKDLPDEVQAKIVAKEGEDERDFEVDDIVKVKATGKKGKVVDMSPSEAFFIVNVGGKNSSFHGSDLVLIKRPSLNEAGDHEVGMAQASLKSIIGAADELMSKIGDQEFDIPGWIQDHITNAENYISQANKGYHKLDNKYEEN